VQEIVEEEEILEETIEEQNARLKKIEELQRLHEHEKINAKKKAEQEAKQRTKEYSKKIAEQVQLLEFLENPDNSCTPSDIQQAQKKLKELRQNHTHDNHSSIHELDEEDAAGKREIELLKKQQTILQEQNKKLKTKEQEQLLETVKKELEKEGKDPNDKQEIQKKIDEKALKEKQQKEKVKQAKIKVKLAKEKKQRKEKRRKQEELELTQLLQHTNADQEFADKLNYEFTIGKRLLSQNQCDQLGLFLQEEQEFNKKKANFREIIYPKIQSEVIKKELETQNPVEENFDNLEKRIETETQKRMEREVNEQFKDSIEIYKKRQAALKKEKISDALVKHGRTIQAEMLHSNEELSQLQLLNFYRTHHNYEPNEDMAPHFYQLVSDFQNKYNELPTKKILMDHEKKLKQKREEDPEVPHGMI